MLAVLAFVALLRAPSVDIPRDSYGVPHIAASSWEEAFYKAGYAVAQDRLWQMELSRRISRGRLSELLGSDYISTDKEVLRFAYSDDELQKQLKELSVKARTAIEAYTKGVNGYISDAEANGGLPPKYGELHAKPEPWSELDSVAISIRLWRMFGRGGAGELRNLAALEYLKTQKCKDHALDVFDDMAWQNDPTSPTTVLPEDDMPASQRPSFPKLTRAITEKHLAMLPKLSFFELLPSVRLASLTTSTRVAQNLNVPYKTGSYAIVVGKNRSATGVPLLLSAPQMGFTNPSIAHEMSISAPGIQTCGMDVPGIPGVLIGYSPTFAWGLTSGVADLEDIFYFKTDAADSYQYGGKSLKIEKLTFNLKVKGQDSQTVTQQRTLYGPIVLSTKSGGGYVFARKSTYWQKEMKAYDSLIRMYSVTKPSQIGEALADCPMTFNLFYAFKSGDIGYRYIGHAPVRADGFDPRLPVPASPENDWKGLIPQSQMPHVENPKSGLLTNWNNKAAAWWPNGDTPVWGAIFRVSILRDALAKPKLKISDLENAAWTIARTTEHGSSLYPLILAKIDRSKLTPMEADALAYLQSFNGRMLDGDQSAAIYNQLYACLQEELFYGSAGNFISEDLFRMVAQPSLVLKAYQGKTIYNYLGSRTQSEVATSAFRKTCQKLSAQAGDDPGLWRYSCPKIMAVGTPPVPYSNRGTYIQLIELRPTPIGRNVTPPGVAESGPHATDQIDLARAWLFKAMRF